MIGNIHINAICAAAFVGGVVPFQVVLAAAARAAAPDRELHLAYAADFISDAGDPRCKLPGIDDISALDMQIVRAGLRRVIVYHGARPGIDGDKLRFIKIER